MVSRTIARNITNEKKTLETNERWTSQKTRLLSRAIKVRKKSHTKYMDRKQMWLVAKFDMRKKIRTKYPSVMKCYGRKYLVQF